MNHPHIFKASYKRLTSRDDWCKLCIAFKRQTSLIKDIQNISRKKGGECLSDQIESLKYRVKLKCSQGHEWMTTAKAIKEGCWCRDCGNKLSLSDFQQLAKSKGGQCLSTTYKSVNHKLDFICLVGHKWSARGNSIRSGHWCPKCADNKKKVSAKLQRAKS